MTSLTNDPTVFARESIEGLIEANAEALVGVAGGVVRATATASGEVAVVMGGGSGHYPAFAGWVGPGFGHGAACGNIFASPSETQILAVARAAAGDAGVIFVPINYAGDILHFTAATERLRSEGVEARLVAITDDIASGTADEHLKRRGIAGGFLVIKMIGAAAVSRYPLGEVERIAIAANAATRSFGVAFSGCILPGDDGPLFEVPAGRIAIGLGIHGEPGISEAPLGTADEVADLLVDGLFAERPPEPGRRVAVLVNGLGATKYDELNLVFRRVRARLDTAGMTVVAPVVGEQVTSLDMAGVSVSLAYLDPELERLWLEPANSVSFHRVAASGGATRPVRSDAHDEAEIPEATSASRDAATSSLALLATAVDVLVAHEFELGRLDAVAGDGDHGAGMLRGARAALAAGTGAVGRGAGLGTTLDAAGAAWSDEAGGTSGALWGAGLRAAGESLGDVAAPASGEIVTAVWAFADAIIARGGAAPGEKTMVDAILPFADQVRAEVAAGAAMREAWTAAAEAASSAASATADLIAGRGRSRVHGTRSIGTPDPGATSFALLVTGLPDAGRD